VPELFWLRAMGSTGVREFLDLLQGGVGPNPDPKHPTKKTEQLLGVDPARVYCYLGRTLESFGTFAFALRPDGLHDGEISPFDSGGLISHIEPIKNWADPERRAYLQTCTWPARDLQTAFEGYPGARGLKAYLDMDRPVPKGPHDVWSTTPVADIWVVNDDWRAWTWEGRWWGTLPKSNIEAWTCAPSFFPAVLDFFSSDSVLGYMDLVDTFVPGGVSALIDTLRARSLKP
jgi:hypothetical protein